MNIRALTIMTLALAAPVAVASTSALMSTTAVAQWSGPSDVGQAGQPDYAATTISAIKAAPNDDQKVTLVGTIIRKTADEKYLFTDGSGEIIVEIDDKKFPKQPVNERTKLKIEGKVDTHMLRDVDIDAERVAIVN